MKRENILAYFSDFSLKSRKLVFFFFCFSYKEEGIHDKVTVWFLLLYTASEHLIVFSCLNKMALKQNKTKKESRSSSSILTINNTGSAVLSNSNSSIIAIIIIILEKADIVEYLGNNNYVFPM